MGTPIGPESGYEECLIGYLPGTDPADQYGERNEALARQYFLSFTDPLRVRRMLVRDFAHVDAGEWISDEPSSRPQLVLGHLAADNSADRFADEFRGEMVRSRVVQAGVASGTYLPRSTAKRLLPPLFAAVREQDHYVHGHLIAAAVVYFPGWLRIGGTPLDMPPDFATAGQPFDPISAEPDHPERNFHLIRVLQYLFANGADGPDVGEDERLLTGRIGVKLARKFAFQGAQYDLGAALTVPGGINEEVLATREDDHIRFPQHDVLAGWLAQNF